MHPSVRSALQKYRLIGFWLFVYFGISLAAQCFTLNQYIWPQKGEWGFPFTRWAMFSGHRNHVSNIHIYEWQGITHEGLTIAVNPAQLYLTSNAVVHFTKTYAMGVRAIESNATENDPIIDVYAEAL